jgi:hypothetical protein
VWCEAYGAIWVGLNRPGGRERGVASVGVRRRASVLRRARGLWRHAGVRGCALWCCHERAGVLDRAEERQRDGGSGLFLLLSSMSHGRVWAGVRGRQQRGERGFRRVLLRG